MAIPSFNSFVLLFRGLWLSKVFWALFFGFVTAIIIKAIVYTVKNKKFTIQSFFSLGGMPSTHTASITALTTAIFFEQGVSTLFVALLALKIVVMTDAQGVRLETQKQAKILRMVADKIQDTKKLRLRVGHTKLEVFVGLILGIIVATIVYLV